MPAAANPPASLSCFGDRSRPPAEPELRRALGPSAALWRGLIEHAAAAYPPIEEHWNHAGAKFGWSLRLKQRDRVLLYLIPQTGRFLAGIVLGDRALAAARETGLPATVLAALAAAPRYAEGTGLRLPVASPTDLDAIQRLLAFKAAPAPPPAKSRRR